MPQMDLLVPFALATLVFAVIPGPGMLHASAQTVVHGRRAGWHAALGFHLAGLGHALAAALGVSAVLAVAPAMLAAMTFAGAAYLVWMGLRLLAGHGRATGAPAPAARAPALRDSLVVEACNPKSMLFFLAFLPQFTDPAAGLPVPVQMLVLGIFVNVVLTLGDLVVIEVVHALAARLGSSRRVATLLRLTGGGIFIALGAAMAITSG